MSETYEERMDKVYSNYPDDDPSDNFWIEQMEREEQMSEEDWKEAGEYEDIFMAGLEFENAMFDALEYLEEKNYQYSEAHFGRAIQNPFCFENFYRIETDFIGETQIKKVVVK